MRITVAALLALLVVAFLLIAFRGRARADKLSVAKSPEATQTALVIPTAADLAPAPKIAKSEGEWKAQLTPAQ